MSFWDRSRSTRIGAWYLAWYFYISYLHLSPAFYTRVAIWRCCLSPKAPRTAGGAIFHEVKRQLARSRQQFFVIPLPGGNVTLAQRLRIYIVIPVRIWCESDWFCPCIPYMGRIWSVTVRQLPTAWFTSLLHFIFTRRCFLQSRSSHACLCENLSSFFYFFTIFICTHIKF